MKSTFYTCASLLFVLSACGKSPSTPPNLLISENTGNENISIQTFSYQFNLNGCDTERHEFNSKSDYCKGLQNHELNKGCALSMRQVRYKDECSEFGEFTQDEVKTSTANSTEEFTLQITVLNFLSGGLEQCDLKNKLFKFSVHDQNIKQTLCKNSKVEVTAESDSGKVTFRAIDLELDSELPITNSSATQTFELGKTKKMLRYGVENPHGFTYVMAEDFTGISIELLNQWNDLNQKYSSLMAEILKAQENGEEAPVEKRVELISIEDQLRKLAQEMEKSRKHQ